ncbi:MAG TPA: flavin reductase family protein [Solirubrobacteraceae bacterium]|jgi:flavin reductase (DIM6/NTAB) family NADH-FMN oxidoreductase RutF|nr:flavin reductase family protein [Solirubrobacteraceae bacterium]
MRNSADSSDAPAAETFHGLVGQLDYPMLIVTTRVGERQAGCLVGFASQVSIDPPRFLVCLSKANRTYRVAAEGAAMLAVHFLPAGAQELAELFGGQTGDEVDKFAHCEWTEGPGGVPILSDCPNWFVGSIRERVPLGDHVGFVLAPVAAAHQEQVQELTFDRARRIQAGHPA